jgi:hypothetical protein
MNDKYLNREYIVFKREEFREWYEDEREMALSEPVPPPDEVENVIFGFWDSDNGPYQSEGEWAQK